MPHLLLEYSNNIFEKKHLTTLFEKCHVLLAEMLPTNVASCKSRAVGFDCYYVGRGEEKNAFVHVTLKIMSGRSVETLQSTGHALMELLKSYFSESLEKLQLGISLEMEDLQATYFKHDN